MAVKRLDPPIRMTAREAGRRYNGLLVLHYKSDFNKPGYLYAYSELDGQASQEEYEGDLKELQQIKSEILKTGGTRGNYKIRKLTCE